MFWCRCVLIAHETPLNPHLRCISEDKNRYLKSFRKENDFCDNNPTVRVITGRGAVLGQLKLSSHWQCGTGALKCEDRYASLWCGFSLIKPHSGWPPVWCSLPVPGLWHCETTCRSLRPWTSSLGQKMAGALGKLLCNPDQVTQVPLIAFSLHFTEFPLFLPNVMEILRTSSSNTFQQLSLQRCCSNTELTAVVVPWGTPEALFGPRSVLVQVSQFWDKTWHATQTPQNHRERKTWGRKSPRRSQSNIQRMQVVLIITIITIIFVIIIDCKKLLINEQNVMVHGINNVEIVINNAA